jgi:hypothetical protein
MPASDPKRPSAFHVFMPNVGDRPSYPPNSGRADCAGAQEMLKQVYSHQVKGEASLKQNASRCLSRRKH